MGHAYLKFVNKVDDVIVIFDSLLSSLFLCIAAPKTSNFFNSHRIKLKFGMRVDFGTPISNFNSKIGLSVKI